MPDLVKGFLQGIMNKDSDERIVPEGQYRDALNIEVNTSESSDVGSVHNVKGNTLVADLATVSGRVTTTAKTIGSVKNDSENIIYWLVACDTFDGLYEYNATTGNTVRVLQSNKSTPTTASKLNFNKNHVVTGINYIDGSLYWNDDLNQPRCVNIARAKSYAVDDDRIDDDINVALKPPLNAPVLILTNDGDDANNMSEKFLYFAYRYKYLDDKYSSLSPFSAVSFEAGEYELDFQAGNNKSMTNIYNGVDIRFETGSQFVKEIQLIVKDTKSPNAKIVETFNKQKLLLADNYSHTFKFKNNKTYSAIPLDQITRLFDNVPLKAKAQDIVGNRLVMGNFVQFRDIVDCNNNAIKIDLNLGITSESVPNGTAKKTFRSDRNYEAAIEYGDEYGRLTTALTSENNTTYIPASQSDDANSLVLKIKNAPPCWATFYRIMIKESKGEYYNLFPILFYSSGLYRYFLINDSDLDKIKIGDYVIFKSDSEGPTHSNKKYKVLELGQKSSNFIGSGTQLPGLYFKIKVNDANEISSSGVFNHTSTGIGSGTIDKTFSQKAQKNCVQDRFSVAEPAIFYGEGNENGMSVVGFTYNGYTDERYTIQIDSPTTFRYTVAIGGGSFIQENVPIVPSTPTAIYIPGTTSTAFSVVFNSAGTYNVGDKWVVNCRAAFGNSIFGVNNPQDVFGDSDIGNRAIIPGSNWGGPDPEIDTPIESGAVITLKIEEDTYNANVNTGLQQFPPSPRRYENLEEWFIESGAYTQFVHIDDNGTNVGPARIMFRRGKDYAFEAGLNTDFNSNVIYQGGSATNETVKYPVRMIIKGFGVNDTNFNYDQNKFRVTFSITQQVNPTICETVPKDSDLDIFHELSKTYPIKDNLHIVNWRYSDFTAPAYAAGYTNLGQVTPGSALTSDDIPHNFVVGDSIYVSSDDDAEVPSGTYTVLQVPDIYNVVIDLTFPGAGPQTGGGISYSQTDTDQINYTLGGEAVIKINNPSTFNSDFNAFCFGNGLESDRIKDDWNETTMDYSPRASTTIDNYKQIRNRSALCYSGVHKQNSSINRLNEFNLSLANFKYLDDEFGSVQKLFARDTDLIVCQEDKFSSVLYGKNLLSDSVGGGQVVSIPEVLGTQIPFPGEYGISKNPESFAYWGGDIFCTDEKRGCVISISGDQIFQISDRGMKDYFRDLFVATPEKQKLGAFDPYHKTYVLSSNSTSTRPCSLSISRPELKIQGKTASSDLSVFDIISEDSWTITLLTLGFGTSWVTDLVTSGTGSQSITCDVAANLTGAVRRVRFRIDYCSGLSTNFVLYQGVGKKKTVLVMISHNTTFE